MNTEDKVKTILFLKPNAEFATNNGEIIWFDQNQTEPTEAEIEAGWIAYQEAQAAEIKAKAAKKAAAQAKLAALGLTVGDLQALGL